MNDDFKESWDLWIIIRALWPEYSKRPPLRLCLCLYSSLHLYFSFEMYTWCPALWPEYSEGPLSWPLLITFIVPKVALTISFIFWQVPSWAETTRGFMHSGKAGRLGGFLSNYQIRLKAPLQARSAEEVFEGPKRNQQFQKWFLHLFCPDLFQSLLGVCF